MAVRTNIKRGRGWKLWEENQYLKNVVGKNIKVYIPEQNNILILIRLYRKNVPQQR